MVSITQPSGSGIIRLTQTQIDMMDFLNVSNGTVIDNLTTGALFIIYDGQLCSYAIGKDGILTDTRNITTRFVAAGLGYDSIALVTTGSVSDVGNPNPQYYNFTAFSGYNSIVLPSVFHVRVNLNAGMGNQSQYNFVLIINGNSYQGIITVWNTTSRVAEVEFPFIEIPVNSSSIQIKCMRTTTGVGSVNSMLNFIQMSVPFCVDFDTGIIQAGKSGSLKSMGYSPAEEEIEENEVLKNESI